MNRKKEKQWLIDWFSGVSFLSHDKMFVRMIYTQKKKKASQIQEN